MIAAWVHSVDVPAEARAFISQALASAGVSVLEPELHREASAGIILTERQPANTAEVVHDTSRQGLTRVLVGVCSTDPPHSNDVWRCMDAGAADVVWHQTLDELRADIVARLTRWVDVDRLVEARTGVQGLEGHSPRWLNTLRQAAEAATYSQAPVLLLGESGTGKEMLARWMHVLDPKPQKREFVVLDCSSVIPELSGSEFFGHERGAFTGAVSPREGAFELANGGTLFLDEVGELSPALQAELLRVVQEGTFKRLGSSIWRDTRFRLICATNRNLLEDEAAGRFRRDFYHRIAGSVLRLPPLRERPEDVLVLAEHFIEQNRVGQVLPRLDPITRQFLLSRAYPGNVRDLKQLVAQLLQRHVGCGPITVGDIPESERETRPKQTDWRDEYFERAIIRALELGVGLRDITSAAAESAIRLALDVEHGSVRKAAYRLGVTDRALQMRRANRRTIARFDEAS